LAPGHLLHKHQIDADAYRELAGLNPRHALSAPSLSTLRARQLRNRIKSDARIRAGMRKGRTLARSGELQRRARQVAGERGQSIERRATLRSSGRSLGERRAASYLRAREARARSLGFPDLESYLRSRYQAGGLIADLQAELGASYSAIRGDLRRLGIPVQHGSRPAGG
jgi:hypothetical protein